MPLKREVKVQIDLVETSESTAQGNDGMKNKAKVRNRRRFSLAAA